MRFVDSRTAFRNAFDGAIDAFEIGGPGTFSIVYAMHHAHCSAIRKFRGQLPWFRRRRFDRAAKQYRDSAQPYINRDVFERFASEQDEFSQSKRNELISSIHSLLRYAKET